MYISNLTRDASTYEKDLYFSTPLIAGANGRITRFFHEGSVNTSVNNRTNLSGNGTQLPSNEKMSVTGIRFEAFLIDATATGDVVIQFLKFMETSMLDVRVNGNSLFERSISCFMPTVNVVGVGSQVINGSVNSLGVIDISEYPLQLDPQMPFEIKIYSDELSSAVTDKIRVKLTLSGTSYKQIVG